MHVPRRTLVPVVLVSGLLLGGCAGLEHEVDAHWGPGGEPVHVDTTWLQQPLSPQPLLPGEKVLLDAAQAAQPEMEALLAEFVNLPTGPGEVTGQRAMGLRVAQLLQDMGFAWKWVSPEEGLRGAEALTLAAAKSAPPCADHLVAHRRGGAGAQMRVLLVGHIDTVHDAQSAFSRYREAADGTATGPGILDMKGGLVVMLQMLRILEEQELIDRADFRVVMNMDEESGSLTSRRIIERQARWADVALVFEGSADYSLTVSRGGLGKFRIEVLGRAAHVAEKEDGVDAVLELANKVVELCKLTDIERGVIVNVAPVHGGTSANTVADYAFCDVDLRYRYEASGKRLFESVQKIARRAFSRSPGKSAERPRTRFWGVLHRPPMFRTPANRQLAHYFQTAGRDLHKRCRLQHSSSGSDANLTAHAGCPTIDGLGPVGEGAHSTGELIILSSLSEKTAMAAIGISRLLQDTPTTLVQQSRQNPGATGER